MPNTKPLVIAATACEKVLHEKDGVLSAIRIVDTVSVPADVSLPEGVNPHVALAALVALKSGDFVGKSEIALTMRTPSGKTVQIGNPLPVVFEGGEHGVNISLGLNISPREFGLYWVDVSWQGEILTSFPIKLMQVQKPSENSSERNSP